MRKGINPIHEQGIILKDAYHRIIIPVYIPYLSGYYKDSFDILKICLKSLVKTIHDKTLITIINNDSCEEVHLFLNDLILQKKIDQYIVNSYNNGKINPITSYLKGCHEKLITISDADVLFKPGWQNAVEGLFVSFPEAGMVSPIAAPSYFSFFTAFTWFYGFLKYKLYRSANPDTFSLEKFHESISRERPLNEIEKSPHFIQNKEAKAIIGSGHFCVTICNEIIPYIPLEFSGTRFKGAETKFIDRPVCSAGFMRIATDKGFVFHMGNIKEGWMQEFLDNILNFKESTRIIPKRKKFINNSFFKFIIYKVFSRSFILKLLGNK